MHDSQWEEEKTKLIKWFLERHENKIAMAVGLAVELGQEEGQKQLKKWFDFPLGLS